jgi:hypothetical protein
LSEADHTRAQKTSEKMAEERREMGREKMELSPVFASRRGLGIG